jgi:hypothetical protein
MASSVGDEFDTGQHRADFHNEHHRVLDHGAGMQLFERIRDRTRDDLLVRERFGLGWCVLFLNP